MGKTYLPYDPEQQLLLPAALQEWLPPDHLAYFISEVVDQLDLSAITARYEEDRRGGPPYHPRMMVKVLLYGYCIGVASSRRIASVSTRTSPSGCWRPTTLQTSAQSPTSARTIWRCWGAVPAGAGVVPAGRTGEAGACGPGRDQGEGQRLQE